MYWDQCSTVNVIYAVFFGCYSSKHTAGVAIAANCACCSLCGMYTTLLVSSRSLLCLVPGVRHQQLCALTRQVIFATHQRKETPDVLRRRLC